MIIYSPWVWPNHAPHPLPAPASSSGAAPTGSSSPAGNGDTSSRATTPAARPANPANLALLHEADLKRRAIRASKGSSQAGADDGTGADPASKTTHPIYATAAGRNVLLPGSQGYRIGIYAFSAFNTIQQTIRLLDDTRDLQGPLTDFPASAGLFLPNDAEPYFVLDYGAPLVLELTAGTESLTTGAVAGFLKYRMLEKWGN